MQNEGNMNDHNKLQIGVISPFQPYESPFKMPDNWNTVDKYNLRKTSDMEQKIKTELGLACRGEVQIALDDLAIIATDLEQKIKGLLSKLSPVLREQTPSPEKESVSQQTFTTKIAINIQQYSSQIEALARQVESISKRVSI